MQKLSGVCLWYFSSVFLFQHFSVWYTLIICSCSAFVVFHRYLLASCCRVLLDKLIGSQLVGKFPAFYGTRKFIAAFTTARHLSQSSATSIQSMPSHPTSWRSILISSHLCLDLPSGLFPSGFPTETQYKSLLFPIRGSSITTLLYLQCAESAGSVCGVSPLHCAVHSSCPVFIELLTW